MRALRRRFRNGRYHRYNARYVRPEKGLFMAHTPTYRGTGVGTGFQKRSCANKNALLIDATVDICVAVADGLAKDAGLMRATPRGPDRSQRRPAGKDWSPAEYPANPAVYAIVYPRPDFIWGISD